MREKAKTYQKNALNPLLFKLGMLKRLPSIVFWGVRLITLDEKGCEVMIPYNWRTQNPFKSIYFAALAGAAELSTGALCQLMLADRGPHSMLVTDFRAEYVKKADNSVIFRCDQGEELSVLLDKLEEPGATTTITMLSVGKNPDGVEVARVFVTWSFRKK